jgi:hypothetical protein
MAPYIDSDKIRKIEVDSLIKDVEFQLNKFSQKKESLTQANIQKLLKEHNSSTNQILLKIFKILIQKSEIEFWFEDALVDAKLQSITIEVRNLIIFSAAEMEGCRFIDPETDGYQLEKIRDIKKYSKKLRRSFERRGKGIISDFLDQAALKVYKEDSENEKGKQQFTMVDIRNLISKYLDAIVELESSISTLDYSVLVGSKRASIAVKKRKIENTSYWNQVATAISSMFKSCTGEFMDTEVALLINYFTEGVCIYTAANIKSIRETQMDRVKQENLEEITEIPTDDI